MAITVGSVGGAALWLTRWPTGRQAKTTVLLAAAGISAGCFIQSNPLAALMGCTAFAVLGGYVAFFHTARYLLFNVVVAVSTTSTIALTLALTGDVVLAVSKWFLVIIANLSLPCVALMFVRLVEMDVTQADVDPLTTLLNRRGFSRQAALLMASAPRSSTCSLLVSMIDLDDFKSVNDVHGHAVGDRALIAVGRCLREASPHAAVVARRGGEEFLVAAWLPDEHVMELGESLRAAIATCPPDITASVGTACIALDDAFAGPADEVIDALIAAADAAMYAAKRAGGNQAQLVRPC